MRKFVVALVIASAAGLSACSGPGPAVNNDDVKLPSPAATLGDPAAPTAPGEVPGSPSPDPAGISLPQGATVQSVNDTCTRLNADVKAKAAAVDMSMKDAASFRATLTLVGDGFRDRSAGFKEQLALGGEPKVTGDLQSLVTTADRVSEATYVLRDSADLMNSEDMTELSKVMELQETATEALDAYSAAVAATDFRACDATT